MPNDRRYDEQESAFILDRASAEPAPEHLLSAGDTPGEERQPRGLTLQQLQEIAVEAGLSPEAVARAAAAVERGDLVPTVQRTYAGLPVGVARTIDFARPVSDDAWDRIVVALRETFAARGRVSRHGSLREWNNGNLIALLEPTAKGHRLRLSTRKGDARALMGFGVGAVLTSALLTIPMWLTSTTAGPAAWGSPALIALMGIGSIARAVWTLPSWARTRAAQMESLAETATRIIDESP